MQFMVLAYDGTDDDAPARRLAARSAHLAKAQQLYKDNTLLFASAILDSAGKMAGSVVFVQFPSEAALRGEWLESEPYVTGNVWQNIRVAPCQIPAFIQQADNA